MLRCYNTTNHHVSEDEESPSHLISSASSTSALLQRHDTRPVLTCSPEGRVSGRWRARTSQPGPPSSSREDSSKKRLQMRSARGPFTGGGEGCGRKRAVCVWPRAVCECVRLSVKSARARCRHNADAIRPRDLLAQSDSQSQHHQIKPRSPTSSGKITKGHTHTYTHRLWLEKNKYEPNVSGSLSSRKEAQSNALPFTCGYRRL